MRSHATRPPNSPRDSGVGVVMPRAMKPDWVSKSKVRQTMWRGISRPVMPREGGASSIRRSSRIDNRRRLLDCPPSRAMTNILHGHQDHRHHPQRRDRAHLLDAACGQCAGADPRRGRAAGRRRPHRAAADAGRAQRREARRRRQELRRGMDHRPRQGAGRSGLHDLLRRRRNAASARARWRRPSPRASTSTRKSRWRCRWTRDWRCCAR